MQLQEVPLSVNRNHINATSPLEGISMIYD